MPWTHVLCPNGQTKTFDECIACKEDDQCIHITIRETLFEQNANWIKTEHTGSNITASTLTGCLRNVYLERTVPYAAAPESAWYSLRGTLIHKIIERPDMDNPYLRRSEMRLASEIDGVRLSGQIDHYQERFLKEGLLLDYKSIGDNGLQYIIHDGAKPDHVWQTNIYAWLARQNGYTVNRIQVVYMSLMQVVATGTNATLHEYLANPPAKTGKRKNMIGLPRLVKRYPSGKQKWQCFYRIPQVQVLTDDEIIAYMRPKIFELQQAYQYAAMPPMADDEMRKWKCADYCHVRAHCDEYERRLREARSVSSV